MNLLRLILGCTISGVITLFTISVPYIFVVCLLIFIILLLCIVLKVVTKYDEIKSSE